MSDLVERLQKECDRHVIGYPGPRRNVAELLHQAKAEITRLQKELETARESLEPFARVADAPLLQAWADTAELDLVDADADTIATLDAHQFRYARKVYRALKDKEVAG